MCEVSYESSRIVSVKRGMSRAKIGKPMWMNYELLRYVRCLLNYLIYGEDGLGGFVKQWDMDVCWIIYYAYEWLFIWELFIIIIELWSGWEPLDIV